jgi:hypothetical protein
MAINPKKLSRTQLSEVIQKMIREALEEAGPLGYLSKTRRPDPKTAWDPKAQAEWEQQQPLPGPRGPTALTGQEEQEPPLEKTVAPLGKLQVGGQSSDPDINKTVVPKTELTPPSPIQQNTPSIADVTQLLQNASEEELEQIRAMLSQNKRPV